ncbi:MAG: hypothetical protein CVT62_01040 [Actinobacteria bacterium HGW-Actinobacteria-2]|nr:MAG: hypothetical protein CVT62_01040 [Actinobacteria bacterium HGW-Actinobacteria-2]
MSDESRPWVERLTHRQWKLLALAVAVAVVVSAAWLWIATGDRKVSYPVVAAGQTYRTPDGAWTLAHMQTVEALPDGYEPVKGAVFVIVDVQADLTAFPVGGFCNWKLRAGEYEFLSVVGYLPKDRKTLTTCQPGGTGVISTAYEVPQKLLSSVDGVVLATKGQPTTVLAGRLG